jgi:uncharacterized protein
VNRDRRMMLRRTLQAYASIAVILSGSVASSSDSWGQELVAEAPPEPVAIPRSTRLTIHSEALARTYDLHIKLPPAYDATANESLTYPVLYLNDATYNFQVAAGITHYPMNAQTIKNFILVGIGYSHGSVGPESRIRDYTPTVNPAWPRETGGAERYMTFVEQEVIPLIESTYRADPARRAYAGHSLGGLFGAYVLLKKPELFRYYVLSSPSFWFDEHVTWNLEEAYAEAHSDLPADVYVAIGGLEGPMVPDVRTFVSKLEARDYRSLKVRALVVDGAAHETVFPTALMNGLLWHFAANRQIPYGY